METERVRRKFALKTRKWMEMGLGKRGGLDWIPKICPVKGSTGDDWSAAPWNVELRLENNFAQIASFSCSVTRLPKDAEGL